MGKKKKAQEEDIDIIEMIDDYDGFIEEEYEDEVVAFLVIPLAEEDLEDLEDAREHKDEPLSSVAYRYLFMEEHLLNGEHPTEVVVVEQELESSSELDAVLKVAGKKASETTLSLAKQAHDALADLPEEKRIEFFKAMHALTKQYGWGTFLREFGKFAGGKALGALLKNLGSDGPSTPSPSNLPVKKG